MSGAALGGGDEERPLKTLHFGFSLEYACADQAIIGGKSRNPVTLTNIALNQRARTAKSPVLFTP